MNLAVAVNMNCATVSLKCFTCYNADTMRLSLRSTDWKMNCKLHRKDWNLR